MTKMRMQQLAVGALLGAMGCVIAALGAVSDNQSAARFGAEPSFAPMAWWLGALVAIVAAAFLFSFAGRRPD